MKKLLTVLIALALTFTLTACDSIKKVVSDEVHQRYDYCTVMKAERVSTGENGGFIWKDTTYDDVIRVDEDGDGNVTIYLSEAVDNNLTKYYEGKIVECYNTFGE